MKDYCPAYLEYHQLAEQGMQDIVQAWAARWGELRGRWCGLRYAVGVAHLRAQRLGNKHKNAIQQVKERRKAQNDLIAQRNAQSIDDRFTIGKKLYAITILAAFLLEAGLNSIAFESFISLSVAAYLAAFGFGIVLLVPAHALGVELRAAKPRRLQVGLITIFVPLLLLALALVRMRYLEARETPASSGYTGIEGVLIFMAFNLAVFLSASFASYFRHDRFRLSLEQAATDLDRASREAEELRRRLEEAENEVAKLQGEAEALREGAEAEYVSARAWAEGERDFYQSLMQVYRGENYRQRMDNSVVSALEEWPEPTVPELFREVHDLDWSCREWENGEVAEA